MERTVNVAVYSPPTLKREDSKRTNHDSAFSNWKILIGAGDWEDYMLNKEGAERYRIHNLPNCNSCPGLYELGIVIPPTQRDGKNSSNLRSNYIIPVYLGQTDNIRTRLQQYGRDGAHLENGLSNGKLIDRKAAGLFSDIFSNGFAVAYRWAPMKCKKDAEKTESQLLRTFDYAWNRGINGERRPGDIHQKLNNAASSTERAFLLLQEMNIFPQNKKGLSVKHCDPTVLEYGSSFYTMKNDIKAPFGIFKFGRSRPTLVSKESDMNNSDVGICGADLGHGFICTRPPVEGRKRCIDHKGMKVTASIRPCLHTNTQDIGQDKHYIPTLKMEPFCIRQKGCEVVKHREKIVNGKKPMILDADLLTCVAITLNGSSCQRESSKDSKFCWQHEPMRSGSLTNTHAICPWEKVKISGADSLTCAAITLSGSSCQRKPSEDSKFCWQHEPMRSRSHTNTQAICRWETVKISGAGSSTCAAITRSGSYCRRKPSNGGKFCWQH